MNVKGILAELEIEVAHEDRVNFNGPCPFHDDSSPSWSINKENGLWLCRAGCGSGNAVQFLQRVLGCTLEQAKAKLIEFSDPKVEISDILKKKLERFASSSVYDYHPPAVQLPPHHQYPTLAGMFLYEKHAKYIESRMMPHTATRLGVGASLNGRYCDYMIVPIQMFDKNVGFIARAIDPNSEKRYLNATNVLYTNLIFNYDAPIGPSGEVYLCESTFDCITLLEAQKPAMATFGARISYRQIELLLRKKVKKIIFCFHSDTAGDEGVKDKLHLLSRLFSIHRMNIPVNSDLNSLGPLISSSLSIEAIVDDNIHRILNSLQWKLEKS